MSFYSFICLNVLVALMNVHNQNEKCEKNLKRSIYLSLSVFWIKTQNKNICIASENKESIFLEEFRLIMREVIIPHVPDQDKIG